MKTLGKLVSCLWLLILICGTGCANISVTLQSNKDLTALRPVRRLFVLIDFGVLEKQPLSKKIDEQLKSNVLAASLKNHLTNTSVQMESATIDPLTLDEKNYESKIRDFHTDAILIVKIKNVIMDQYGGYPIIYYDATLFDEITRKYVWRAAINNSGNPDAMDERLQKMAEAIVARLRTDGFIEDQ